MPDMLVYGFYVTIGIVAVFYFFRRKEKLPSRLKLEAFKGDKSKIQGIRKVKAEPVGDEEAHDFGDVFIYQNKKYNAWEVLGTPQGSSLKKIQAVYAYKVSADPNNKALYVKALKTLT